MIRKTDVSEGAVSDTIFAPATAPGRAGIAVVRVSGPDSWASLERLSGGRPLPQPRRTALRTLIDPVSRETIDRAMVIGFRAPASFTGEDVVEYHLHGGRAVVESLMTALGACAGHRLAMPGEFTRRAFEHGRMDLTEAEAVADLINAETALQKQQALIQMGGALSALYDGWAKRLARALAHIEADLDFPDEDLPDGVMDESLPVLRALADEIAAHMDDNRRGERLRDGVQVAVIGAPNAGKSSLVNALAQRDVAIVSEQAGTTRDVIEVHLDLGGYPVIVADTAGLRPDQIGNEGAEAIEGEGIRRALQRARDADIKLLLFDAAQLPAIDPHTSALFDEHALVVFNKCEQAVSEPPPIEGQAPIAISVLRAQGLTALTDRLVDMIRARLGKAETPSLTRTRHRQALAECHAALERAMTARMPELMAEDVRLAMRALGRITGRVDVEDLLDIIFRDFCIGK